MWTTIDPKKKILFVLAAVAALIAIAGLVRVATTPSLSLLYAGLDPAVSGEVITSLDQQGITYEVRGNAIYVDAASRDQTRLSLASEGLPGAGITGYELLDNLSGFGQQARCLMPLIGGPKRESWPEPWLPLRRCARRVYTLPPE